MTVGVTVTDAVELPTEAVYGSVPEAKLGLRDPAVEVKALRVESFEAALVTVMV